MGLLTNGVSYTCGCSQVRVACKLGLLGMDVKKKNNIFPSSQPSLETDRATE